jgi:ech hydrogenase subunit D
VKQEQSIEIISVGSLLARVQSLRDQGYRPVQISATRFPDKVELTYSFDLNAALLSLRLDLPADAPKVPSISSIFGCVVLYENELHDLFNIQVEGMALDLRGNLYQTSVKFPFGTVKAPAAPTSAQSSPKPAPAPAVAGTIAPATVK